MVTPVSASASLALWKLTTHSSLVVYETISPRAWPPFTIGPPLSPPQMLSVLPGWQIQTEPKR